MSVTELQMMLTFAVIAAAVVGFAIERLAIEITALSAIVVLIVIFVVVPDLFDAPSALSLEDLLRGFANPALLTVLSLIIVGQALFQTGALERPTQWLAHTDWLGTPMLVAAMLIGACALSAFLNNTPVVVLMIPVLIEVARERRLQVSRLLMPLSFATILGGSTTLIGSSTNLLVAGEARLLAGIDLGFFDITVPGVVLALAGLSYVILVQPLLLREGRGEDTATTSGKHFLAEIGIDPASPLAGLETKAGFFPTLKGITVPQVRRGRKVFQPPFDELTLEEGDVVQMVGTRRALRAAGATSTRISQDGEDDGSSRRGGLVVAESIVAPGSRLVGRSPRDTGLHSTTGTRVIAVERRGRMGRTSFGDLRLEAGDVLLLAGDEDGFERLRDQRDVLLLEQSGVPLPHRGNALRAGLIFSMMVVSAASGLVSIAIAALLAAFGMLALGCLNLRQAKRAFDSQIYMLVGASLAMAAAFERTGGAQMVARSFVDLLDDSGPRILLSGLFLLIALLTNVLSNNATALLFTPIVLSAAHSLDAPPEPFLITVILAANASFATPIGYQTNLLVMRPGGYVFRDFLLAGTPLMLILWATFSLFAPWYYGL